MSFKITVLGSNSALPSEERYCSAHVINLHERFFLVDCGEGTQIRLRKFRIRYSQINHIFISHLHGDHYFGLFGLISSYTMLGRKSDLHIYSPGNLEKRIFSVLSKSEIGFQIFFHRIETDQLFPLYESKSSTISCFPLKHRIETYGFIFQEKAKLKNIKKELIQHYQIGIKDILSIKQGNDFMCDSGLIKNSELTYPSHKARTYVYCSDTAFAPEIVDYISNADLLYHEATFAEDLKETAIQTLHSTGRDAGTIAKDANIKTLLIGHFSSRYKTQEIILREAREVFENTIAVTDGDCFEIHQERESE